MDPWEKSSTVDPEVRAYVTSLVNAVGGRSTYDDSYSVGDDAIAVLKDLQRWLRLYDEKTNRLDVKRCLAEANLVKGDLLEILALWPEDAQDNKHKSKLALACLELLVPLTWPIALEDEKATVNHHRHVPYLSLAQVGYKRAVLHFEFAKILRTAVRVGLAPMATPRRERSRRDEGILKLVMYFFRNIAMITQPQHLPSQGDENEISRSSTIEAFHEQDVFSALLTLGSGMGDEFQEQDVILLEILFHLLKGVDARKLFMKKEQVTTEATTELENLMRKEKAMINSYNKHAPTRHNRFGTMIWVKRDEMKMSTVSGQTSITDENTTLQQMDSSKKWNKPQYRGMLAQEFDENSDFGASVDLTENAREHLRKFVEDFLDSSFNPLFVSLRKAIEREADRVLSSMHNKQYFFLISWFLSAEAARRDTSRRDSTWNADRATQTNPEDNTFAYIAAVLDQETFVLLNRQMQNAFDNKSWQDLRATLLCFTQILLTVQNMSESKDEEDLEIAENIQNRIFYEEATHDRIVQILRGYTHQGFAYLDAVTECVHVFVRMLERYAKQNVDMQIRSKRRARKKQKQTSTTEGGAEGEPEDAAEDERDAHRTVSERKFDFARFSTKFLSQQCVNTFISLTHFYRDLSPVQLKRAHRFFYRLAFKHELGVLLFRADILALFQKMIKGPEGLDSAMDGFKDWEQLVQQVFRRCIKWMERETEGEGWKQAAVVEMLFSKIPGTMFYLQNGFERVVEKRAPRPPAELEIKGTVAEEQRVGVAVSIMIEQAKADSVTWVKKLLDDAARERQAWEEGQAVHLGMMDEGEDGAAIQPASCPSIFLVPDTDERKMALFKDKHLRLLLTTLGFQRLGLAEDVDASWIIPSELTSSQLTEALDQIRKAEFDPPTFEDDKKAEDFIRSKAKRPTFDDNDSDSDGAAGSGGELDEAMFPPNLKEKRKKRAEGDEERPKKRRRRDPIAIELTEEELSAKRKAKEKKDREKNAKIKSNLYVTAEDDESDEEADAEFFRQEEERRKKTDGVIRGALLKQMEEAETEVVTGKKGKKKSAAKAKALNAKAALKSVRKPAKKRRKANDRDSDEDQIMIDAGDESDSETASPSTSTRAAPIELSDNDPSSSELEDNESDKAADSDAEAEKEKETPSTSPTPAKKAPSSQPLKEVSANAGTTKIVDSDSEDDMPVSKPAAMRRNVRAGFIIDDSDDE
ncbi:Topoisomerase 1-associated factor 1 [Fulvia fulva]|uniref:Topoisomerase 1-associated factor 1 n=1 Tax=Passalora fulva TaxID=5499 RepID=A0A9Q8PBY9_PASFU|nr:Topoisomerase 1-associated factor 1 [Fulvia fulva]KAK4620050.1 Topoisomerase 1-associated factor 1 [Fulvia fulva]KAK4620245.1 Topoisomerase 1-associated factor 1 [Fulvia fulva]UJO19724.1 Topoisomerase 1-associated factor 1 [Fulvia fulva]WPV16866.1 Topoisomerase 1-associated factor 1 [Fulvia fulva]WPV32278.1 Topoisomerase 1-associated factor 1 [Fulvia fulva]